MKTLDPTLTGRRMRAEDAKMRNLDSKPRSVWA